MKRLFTDPENETLLAIARIPRLPPSIYHQIEAGIPGAQPGDLLAGRIAVMHDRWTRNRTQLEVSVATPWHDHLVTVAVEVFSRDDVRQIAEVIKMLDEWDRRAKNGDGEKGGGDDGT